MPATAEQRSRYRTSERGRAENRERMRRRRAAMRACGQTGAQAALRSALAWLGWGVCLHCFHVVPAGGLEADHRVPVIAGGCDTAGNIQPLCTGCHQAKTIQERAWR